MGVRTSVTGCITLLGVVSVAAGCSGRVPGQAEAIDLRALAPGASKQLAAMGAASATASLKAMAVTPEAQRALAEAKAVVGEKAGEPVASVAGGDVPAAKAAGDKAPSPETPIETVASAPVDAGAKAAEPAADQARPPVGEGPAIAPPVEVEPAPPELGFTIPGLADLAQAFTTEDTRVLFQDSFDDGLAAWVSRGLGTPATVADAAADAVVLATGRARRSLWIKTVSEIDLAGSAQPRLRLDFKGQVVALKAVWETDNGAFPEEILLTPAEADDAVENAPPEYDLTALRGRPGHLVLVARAPRGTAAAPVLDAVTIYDAAIAATGPDVIASR